MATSVFIPKASSGPSSNAFRLAFTNGDLAAGVLTVLHNLGQLTQHVTVSDETNTIIGPDDVTFVNMNSLTVDLSTFGVITGAWNVVVGG